MACEPWNEQISNSLLIERLIASLSAVFGFLATLLAVIGLYGVMAYTVARRTREIGIRMALGALQGDVIWMVMREVLVLVAVGLAVGLAGAFVLVKLIQTQLYGLTRPRSAYRRTGCARFGGRGLCGRLHSGRARQPDRCDASVALRVRRAGRCAVLALRTQRIRTIPQRTVPDAIAVDHHFHAAVLLASGGGGIRCDGPRVAVSNGYHRDWTRASCDQRGSNGLRVTLRESLSTSA